MPQPRRALRALIPAFAALAIAATGLGTVAGATPPPPRPDSAAISAPRDERVPRPRRNSLEYRLSWGLAAIKADRAYAEGFDGRGVTVALIDMGLESAALALFGSLSPASTDLVARPPRGADRSDHGRDTATLLAAALDGRGTVGVAYGAELLAIRVDAAGSCASLCYATTRDLARGIDHALAHGARVIGVPMVGEKRLAGIEPALERAARQGAVIVAAAGNDGGGEPAWPGRYAADPRFRDAVVIAGASTFRGRLATWSNQAGSGRDRFVTAPGEHLLVDCGRRTCRLVSGTSYSVAYVAGALSLVMAARPDLSAQQAARVLLDSAGDGKGQARVTDGRGLVDLARAVKAARRGA